MKKFLIGLVLVVVVMVVMNPSKETHVHDYMKHAMKVTGYEIGKGDSDLERAGIVLGYSLAVGSINNVTTYHNFGVMSVLSMDDTTVSVGCMGFVYSRVGTIEEETKSTRTAEVAGNLKEITKMMLFFDDEKTEYTKLSDLNWQSNTQSYFEYYLENNSGTFRACARPIDVHGVPAKYKKVCMNKQFVIEYHDESDLYLSNSSWVLVCILLFILGLGLSLWVLSDKQH